MSVAPWLLSARTPEALRDQARALLSWLDRARGRRSPTWVTASP
ncbi:hypothetical protein [Micromonospora tarensis]|nr:hypothetical protein [Micromonospora tarensis]